MSRHAANAKPRYRALAVSFAVSALLVIAAGRVPDGPGSLQILGQTGWPILRLMVLITLGLVVGQVIEAAGWTRKLSFLAEPLFRFGNLGARCSAAFTTAFFSGVAANAMLYDHYREGRIEKRQLFLTNFVNQLPAFFLHLPTTFFIVIPLTRWAGALYFLLTFLAVVLRTALLLIYGHMKVAPPDGGGPSHDAAAEGVGRKRVPDVAAAVRRRLPSRVAGIAIWVVPVYIGVHLINAMGLFAALRQAMAGMAVGAVVPVESLSVVILSFAAEFTSGFAAAGALMDAGVLTVKQTVLALLVGNVLAFPVRALRHQLPRYVGIFTPKMGMQLLLAGQGLRIASLVLVGVAYFLVG